MRSKEFTLNKEYAQAITILVEECQDIALLDFILTLLRESIEQS